MSNTSLWGGRFSKDTAKEMEVFSSSIDTDARLWAVDIRVSMAHAEMLGKQGILAKSDVDKILVGLLIIFQELSSGTWSFDPNAEDIHGEIEKRLLEKIGEPAKKLHTARSRNDQVATDTRLYLAERVQDSIADITSLQKTLVAIAEPHATSLLPGMTHLQHAQPVSLAHHLLAYFWMLERDKARLTESLPRILSLTLGSAALAGTGFPLDRQHVKESLEFSSVAENSMDAVSDRDFVIEYLSSASIIMMHLSRLCEELILWSTPEFDFVELGDEVTTGSSIMPQKKNPDAAELVRGRTGRVYGALMGALTMMKSLPLAYNRDMQEDKIHLFAGLDTTQACLKISRLVLETASWRTENMSAALSGDFSNATDLADDLAARGVSFREAHEIVGRIVQDCIETGKTLEGLTLPDLHKYSPVFDRNTLDKLQFTAVLAARNSEGGTSPTAVRKQITKAKAFLARKSPREPFPAPEPAATHP